MASETIQLIFDPVLGVQSKKKLSKDSKRAGEKSGEKFSDGFEKGLDLKKAALVAGAAVAAASALIVKASVSAAAEVEQIGVRLAGLTGSAEGAAVVLKDLREFAASTPFRLTDIANASTKLIAFGVSAAEVKDRIKEIGDVAAGSGADLGEVATIYGQVGAAGKLTGERLLQLQERAIPIGPALAKTLGVATSEIKKLVSEGKVSVDDFNRSFASLSGTGGPFLNALQKQSQTLSGVFSTLQDNVFEVGVILGEAFKPALIEAGKALTAVFQKIATILVKNKDAIQETISSIISFFVTTPSNSLVNGILNVTSATEDLDAEIVKAEASIVQLKNTLSRQTGDDVSLIDRFFGNPEGTRDLIKKAKENLLELKNSRLQIEKDGLAEEAALRLLDDQAKQKRRDQELARIQEDKAMALAALGNLGLQRQQVLQQQFDKEIDLILAAEEKRAITKEQADARILALEKKLQADLKDVKDKSKKEDEKRSFDLASSIGSGISNSVQSFVTAVANGQDALEAIGKSVLGIIANMAIQIGEFLIITGLGKLALEAAPGGAVIAAGVGLVAFGTLLSALSGGGAEGGSVGGGVGAATGVESNQEASAIVDEPEERTTETGVNVNIAGDFLDSDEGGLKIVQAINNAFETQGAVIRTGIA